MDSLLLHAQDLAKQACAPFLSIPKRIAYVVSHGQSYASNGYAVRTQGIAQALNEHGFETLCFVRPGRPWSVDKTRSIQIASEVKVKGVRYIHTRQTADSRDEVVELENDVQRYIELFKVYRPEVVIAASNYKAGLPAWVAAQRLGLPFYNEVRGFWELSKDAHEPGYANTAAFKKEQERDTFVAQQALQVFTLNQPMKDELVRRGVETSKIQLVPNGVSELPEIKPADPELKRKLGINAGDKVIGYVGSFNAYEGLDLLVEACVSLVEQGEPIKLLLVGDDQPIAEIKNKKITNDKKPWMIQVGRVQHEQVADYYALIDTVVIPRKKLSVCEVVPPMKIVEALAYNKRVVVSDVRPLAEYSYRYDRVFSYEAGNILNLIQSIQNALRSEGCLKVDQSLLFYKSTNVLAEEFRAADTVQGVEDIYLEKVLVKEGSYFNKTVGEVIVLINQEFSDAIKKANELTRLAKVLIGKNNNQALFFGKIACETDGKDYRKKWYGFLLFNTGSIKKSYEVLSDLSPEYKLREVEKYKLNYITGCMRLSKNIKNLPYLHLSRNKPVITNRVLYVASSSRPYHYNGYTSRTHGIIKGIMGHGWDVLCVTRPGYPADRDDRSSGMEIEYGIRELDGVKYQALRGLHRRNVPLDEYLYHSVEVIAEKAKEYGAAVIHAASNYEAALPALLAAKKLGVKFIYEVRGLWEYTAASRHPGWEETERFGLDVLLESLVVKNADAVATLTKALAMELLQRGGQERNISIVPNAIDCTEFRYRERNESIAKRHNFFAEDFIIGYAGSIVNYEGLDDLILAFFKLYVEYPKVKLLIIGDGKSLNSLREMAKGLGVEDRVIFTGRVTPDEVPEYLSLVNLIALPRKDYKVCQLVSPLKPFEAMAMGIPVLVSNVKALDEIVQGGELGLIYKVGDIESLANCLRDIFNNKYDLKAISIEAQRYVVNNHNWDQVTKNIVKLYED